MTVWKPGYPAYGCEISVGSALYDPSTAGPKLSAFLGKHMDFSAAERDHPDFFSEHHMVFFGRNGKHRDWAESGKLRCRGRLSRRLRAWERHVRLPHADHRVEQQHLQLHGLAPHLRQVTRRPQQQRARRCYAQALA